MNLSTPWKAIENAFYYKVGFVAKSSAFVFSFHIKEVIGSRYSIFKSRLSKPTPTNKGAKTWN